VSKWIVWLGQDYITHDRPVATERWRL